MNLKYLFAAAAVAIFAFASAPVEANQSLVVDQKIQEKFVKAQPVLGRAVDRESFNGKPLLVTFFASW